VRLAHLALAVSDRRRSARFYEANFGLRVLRTEADGVVMMGDGHGATLALGPGGDGALPAFLHFGFPLESADAVRDARAGFAAADVPEVAFCEEPTYVSVKVADPDGYVVEVFWEQA
jgi:catechol 2,3-dioxygenase-like lactoylglutathione lyase family enzyme